MPEAGLPSNSMGGLTDNGRQKICGIIVSRDDSGARIWRCTSAIYGHKQDNTQVWQIIFSKDDHTNAYLYT